MVDASPSSIYHYKSGRWLWNEKQQLAARYIKFNLNALCSLAAQSVGSKSCVAATTLTEGNFRKEVITKVPNPNAGRRHGTTASEVAVMDFVWSFFFFWNLLSQFWDDISTVNKAQIVKQLVQFDKALASNPFPQYRSLYHADDANGPDRFVVGPTTNRQYFDDGRVSLDLDRGPYCYITLFQYLLPKDKATHHPVLWHPDLHRDNIFIDPDNRSKITGIIGWQAAHIAPPFLQARRPGLLDFDGPLPESLKVPKLQCKKLHTNQVLYDAGKALRGRETLLGRLSGLAGSLFSDGEPIVLGYLIPRPLVPGPISFTKKERSQRIEDQAKWEEGVKIMAYSGWDGFASSCRLRRLEESCG
ncbi:hypothetical protein BDW59DRAFT_171719 [Aspergillus cavernicola]|uniref:Altered inheritance of mitochondria protein 9, mitochondrial n=1 Tax=Aspergillus cavernicola TaxID=176166 RepID=A0ABR4IFR5_9EURO